MDICYTHCWLCPIDHSLPSEYRSVEPATGPKGSRTILTPLASDNMSAANLGIVPLCREHGDMELCGGCLSNSNIEMQNPSSEDEHSFKLSGTCDLGAFGLPLVDACELCRVYALDRAGLGSLDYYETVESYHYVKHGEGSAQAAVETLKEKDWLFDNTLLKEDLEEAAETNYNRPYKAKDRRRSAFKWQYGQMMEFCDSNGYVDEVRNSRYLYVTTLAN